MLAVFLPSLAVFARNYPRRPVDMLKPIENRLVLDAHVVDHAPDLVALIPISYQIPVPGVPSGDGPGIRDVRTPARADEPFPAVEARDGDGFA